VAPQIQVSYLGSAVQLVDRNVYCTNTAALQRRRWNRFSIDIPLQILETCLNKEQYSNSTIKADALYGVKHCWFDWQKLRERADIMA